MSKNTYPGKRDDEFTGKAGRRQKEKRVAEGEKVR